MNGFSLSPVCECVSLRGSRTSSQPAQVFATPTMWQFQNRCFGCYENTHLLLKCLCDIWLFIWLMYVYLFHDWGSAHVSNCIELFELIRLWIVVRWHPIQQALLRRFWQRPPFSPLFASIYLECKYILGNWISRCNVCNFFVVISIVFSLKWFRLVCRKIIDRRSTDDLYAFPFLFGFLL